MDIPTAQTAGQLAAGIVGLQALIGGFKQAMTDGASITGYTHVSDPASGQQDFPIPAMTPAESAQIFTLGSTIFQARLDALTAQLAAM